MEIVKPSAETVATYWSDFTTATGVNSAPTDVYAFGDTAEMANDLAALVLLGTKRATASAVRELEALGVTVHVGDLSVVHDSTGRPVCVVRTTDVRVGPLSSVDDQFAWDEGEGDRTRTDWVTGHLAYFTRSFPRQGFTIEHDPTLVFERFVVVWPPEAADHSPTQP